MGIEIPSKPLTRCECNARLHDYPFPKSPVTAKMYRPFILIVQILRIKTGPALYHTELDLSVHFSIGILIGDLSDMTSPTSAGKMLL